MATKPNVELGFFYNKDTPTYWKFFFWLLIEKFSTLKYWAIFFVFCFFASSIFNTSLSVISNTYNSYQSYSTQNKIEQNRLKKELLSSLSFQQVDSDIKSINHKITSLYQKAITSKKARNSSSTKEEVNSVYRQMNATVASELEDSYKLLTMLQHPSEANYELLSTSEISEALAVIKSYTSSNKLSSSIQSSTLFNIIATEP